MNKTKSLPSFAMLLAGYGYDVALWGAYPEYVELLWGQTPRKHWKLALPRKDSGKIREIFRKCLALEYLLSYPRSAVTVPAKVKGG